MKRAAVLQRRRLLDDFFRVDEAELTFERYDGSMTPPLRRLVIERGDSAAALVYHRDTGSVIMIEQFRFPTLDKGPGWTLEVPAGMIDRGEEPQEAMRRELEEEIGFRVDELRHVATFYVSPGGSSERIWLYCAEVSEAQRVSDGGGKRSEEEDIRLVSMPLERLARALEAGELVDAKTIIGVQWLLAREPG